MTTTNEPSTERRETPWEEMTHGGTMSDDEFPRSYGTTEANDTPTCECAGILSPTYGPHHLEKCHYRYRMPTDTPPNATEGRLTMEAFLASEDGAFISAVRDKAREIDAEITELTARYNLTVESSAATEIARHKAEVEVLQLRADMDGTGLYRELTDLREEVLRLREALRVIASANSQTILPWIDANGAELDGRDVRTIVATTALAQSILKDAPKE